MRLFMSGKAFAVHNATKSRIATRRWTAAYGDIALQHYGKRSRAVKPSLRRQTME
jgi:hypothetical protein